jgi:hypothetical protein
MNSANIRYICDTIQYVELNLSALPLSALVLMIPDDLSYVPIYQLSLILLPTH